MSEPKYLSNAELVNELGSCRNPTWSIEEHDRKDALMKEVLYRLNEPWRETKEVKPT